MTSNTNSHKITLDIVEAGKGTGWANFPAYDGSDFPISARRDDGKWYVHAGISDEYRAEDARLVLALKKLAVQIGAANDDTICIGDDSSPSQKIYAARTGKLLRKESRTTDTQESAPTSDQATHVVTFLDGTTERVTVTSSTYEPDASYGAAGSVTAHTVNGVSRTYRFGPSGDNYKMETVQEYATRTDPATDQEIAEALAILRNGAVESHKTSIRKMVAFELDKRKLAVYGDAGSDTWWTLSLWTPEDSYDTPSSEEFLTTDGKIVLVYDVDLYTLNSRVQYADESDGYVSVFDLSPLKYAVKHEYSQKSADQNTPSSEKFATSEGEILTVLSVNPQTHMARVTGVSLTWDDMSVREVSVFDLTPERRYYNYSLDVTGAGAENAAAIAMWQAKSDRNPFWYH